jgi:iduronate 2-sulfatase
MECSVSKVLGSNEVSDFDVVVTGYGAAGRNAGVNQVNAKILHQTAEMIAVLTVCMVVLAAYVHAAEELKQTNLLLIMFDDLRPELSFYGRDYVVTPNFERLAARSVIFDHAYCQVAVCNPSRNSLLTGLRPDTTGSYNFDRGFHPHLPLPAQLVKMGYNTAASGKIAHWVDGDKNMWNVDHWENGWYDYQNSESRYMNSSVMPDKVKPLNKFRDYEFATKTIEQLRKVAAKPQYFMTAVGFKLPHLDLHIPHKYFELYKNKQEKWRLNRKELKYPSSLSEISYRCCAEGRFRFMREEGALPHNHSAPLMDINKALPQQMHDELMMGYLGGISYLDAQIGRILDVMDELQLWENTTVVLTSDHGMHNGEKGIW